MVSIVFPELLQVKGRSWLGAVALTCLVGLVCVSGAGAQEEPPDELIVPQVTQTDEDGDGVPERTDIRLDFGTGNDLVQIYDRAGNMQASVDWQKATDFEDDLWIFDARIDQKADLVIDFHREGESLVADLYDDRDGDGKVSYSTARGQVAVTEPKGPTIRVVSLDGWWQRDNKVNFNLYLEIDGPVRASFTSPAVRWRSAPAGSLPSMADGDPDVTILVRDVDNDGRPDYDLRQVLSTSAIWTKYGTELVVNSRDSEAPIIDSLFWPYLGGLTGYMKRNGESMPPIQLDWSPGRISLVAEFVASRGGDSNWFVYSFDRFGAGEDVYANFENPFAFYDLASDLDGVPELAARSEYYGPLEPIFPGGLLPHPIENIRYSWDQDNDGAWDFSVNLIGRHPISKVVTFPEFAVQTVPYDEFANWIIEHEWDTGVLVAVEGISYSSSEGIYEGSVRAWRDSYVTGQTSFPDMEQVHDVRAGLRLEYTPYLQAQAWLYLSPVDRRLHLRNAQGGVWNVDDALRVRYADLDGDGYLDQWQVTTEAPRGSRAAGHTGREDTAQHPVSGEVVASLRLAGGILIYGDSGQVRLVSAMAEPSLFETLPPRDHREWLSLGQQLERHAADFAPDALLEMANQLQGPTTHIQGATLADFRLTEDGFRFVLDLQPGFQVIDDTNRLDVNDLTDGSYLVTYDSEFQVRPLTPPKLTVPQGGITTEPPSPEQGDWATIRVVVSNKRLQDATSVPIKVYASRPEGQPFLLAEEQLFIPGEGEGVLEFGWWPVEAGEWAIRVEADTSNAVPTRIDLGTISSLHLDVHPASVSEPFTPLAGTNDKPLILPVASLILVAGLAAMSTLLIVLIHARALDRSGSASQRLPPTGEPTVERRT
jgi:hypothetical protein